MREIIEELINKFNGSYKIYEEVIKKLIKRQFFFLYKLFIFSKINFQLNVILSLPNLVIYLFL